MKTGLVLVAIVVLAGVFAFLTRGYWQHWLTAPRPLDAASLATLYAQTPPPADKQLAVYHLGHSLVGRDMPAMLAQIAGEEHQWNTQLGWGTSLKEHWAGPEAIRGYETENDHSHFRDAKEALASGDYDAVVFTEMVEIRDAIRYHDTARSLAQWLQVAAEGNPDVRLYLYETWHPLDDPDGWLERIDADLSRHWEGEVLHPALSEVEPLRPVWVIPGGQVMAAFTRAIEGDDGMPGLNERRHLFHRTPDGTQDNIHFNAWGAYLIALTHYAVIYGKDPRGLTADMMLADGTPMPALPEGAAELMQQVVWDVVTAYPATGVAAGNGGS